MTLILTLATYNKVVQVSDRRLTWPDGSLDDDESNKAICVSCKDACFSIAYTGLSKIGKNLIDSDDWLANYLTSIDAARKQLIFISKSLDSTLPSVLNETPVHERIKDITFVFAGYWDGHPFVMSISNRNFSQVYMMKPDISPKTANAIFIHGWVQAVDRNIHQRIKKLKRKRFFQSADFEDVAEKLVFLIRASTRTPQAKNRVGRSCMSVVITLKPDLPKNCNFRAKYHPDKESPIGYSPHFITYMGTYSHMEFSLGDKP